MPNATKETATSMDLETKVMDFLAKVESIDNKTQKIEFATQRIEDSIHRVEQLLLHLCDEVMPDHPEIAKIRKEILEQW